MSVANTDVDADTGRLLQPERFFHAVVLNVDCLRRPFVLPTRFNHLVFLRIMHCTGDVTIPEDGEYPNLKTMNLIGNEGEVRLPTSMPGLKSLTCRECPRLKRVPKDARRLRHLFLRKCDALENIPEKLPRVASMSCTGCPLITHLRYDMPKLRELALPVTFELSDMPLSPVLGSSRIYFGAMTIYRTVYVKQGVYEAEYARRMRVRTLRTTIVWLAEQPNTIPMDAARTIASSFL